MKKNILVFLSIFALGLLLITTTNAAPVAGTQPVIIWNEYKMSPSIYDIAVGDTYVWGAFPEGAIRWHKVDQTYTIFTQANGLIDSNVTAVEIDKNGHVWFGTPSGLSRLAGNSWSHFTTSNGLVSNNVLSLSLSPNGELLVGTTGGLSIFNGSTWSSHISTPITDPDNCLTSGITDAEIAKNGTIWIGTQSSPTCYLNGTIWRTLSRDWTSVNASEIEISENGDLWLADVYYDNEYGVMRYEANGTWHHYTQANGLLADETTSLTIDTSGQVWVGISGFGSYEEGVSVFNGSNWISYSALNGYYGGGVNTIEADGTNNIWTGGMQNVSHLVNTSWKAFLAGPPRASSYDITFDQDGHLWMGFWRNGAVEYDGQKWVHYTSANGLPGDHVVDIFVDNDGNTWLACFEEQGDLIGRGLTKYDGVQWQTYTVSDGLASDSIENIGMDSNGQLWVVYRYGGVGKLTSSGWINYTTSDGLLHERAGKVFSQDGDIWFTHRGGYAFSSGISQFDGTNWSSYESELLFNEVVDFTTDSSGSLHALAANGVNIFDGTDWGGFALPDVTQFDPPIYSFTATEFSFDNNDVLWVAGYNGLFHFDGTNWFFYDESNTLVSRLEGQIAVDPNGTEIWVNSLGGVVNLKVLDVTSQVFLPMVKR